MQSHHTTIITGKNGAGKSTFLDALTFSLFGRPFRNINKPTLVNSINARDCLVEIEFSSGTKKYKVLRGLKPNVFEVYCDGLLINQDAKSKDYQGYLEKIILKMNFKSFTQIVVLGTATFVPFMQLDAKDRRSIIEDLLDIQIFSAMNAILKQRITDNRDALVSKKYEQDIASVKLESSSKIIEEMKSHTSSKIAKHKADIEENKVKMDSLVAASQLVQKHIELLQNQIADEQKTKSRISQYLGIESKISTNIRKIKKEIEFYTSNDDCPICQQELAPDFKSAKVGEKTVRIGELTVGKDDIEKKIQEISNRIKEIEDVSKRISDHASEIVRYSVKINETHRLIEKIQGEVEREDIEHIGLAEEQARLLELETGIENLVREQKKLILDRQYHDIAANLLKDNGIKTKVIKQYLPIINKLINKYLAEMDFFVNFTLDESFEESIRSRFRDVFSYENFSEGEKTRIDLSLMFTWREVAKLKNSVNTNLIVFDEILDSSLDFPGTDILVNILNGFDKRSNIFIISHKNDVLGDRFQNSIKFEKHGNFSVII